MNNFKSLLFLLVLLFSVLSCKKEKKQELPLTPIKSEFTIAFGSCNNQNIHNNFWDEILKNNPNIWIWGGDNIYCNTTNKNTLEVNYAIQKNNITYQNFSKKIKITGTWDDNDYGKNDGGVEYSLKKESQQLLLDFLDVPINDKRRKQEGVYHAINLPVHDKFIKIIVLDTRYFRSALTLDTLTSKRYIPNKNNTGTMLGNQQWQWLENELKTSKASFNIIVSSIQFLSNSHGYECWANMPHEMDKLEKLLKSTAAKNCIIISGDRHASEFSKKDINGLSYPLIDFTSSGLTHSGPLNKVEKNSYRVGELITTRSFGLIKIDLNKNAAQFEIRGDENKLLEKYNETYN